MHISVEKDDLRVNGEWEKGKRKRYKSRKASSSCNAVAERDVGR